MKIERVSRRLRCFFRDNEAVSALEYAVLAGVVVAGMGAAVVSFETELTDAIEAVSTNLDGNTDVTDAGNQ